MTSELEQLLKSLPEHLEKTNTLKFIECLKPCLNYAENLLIELQGMTNIQKATGQYLDYIGFKNGLERGNLTDNEFRSFILTARFKMLNAPTNDALLKLTKDLTGFDPAVIEFYPNGEPASQYLKFIVPYTTDLNKFPDYNEFIDAGARIYREIVSIAGRRRYRPKFTAGLHQINMFIENNEVMTGGKKR